ncbi:hypothetical protein [Companilactobacillus hulinensis]|uniref:hypothetical protein n=1 Tax=Companilactobacillus hulinensis TaxID=2486007 RepID=UPI0013DDA17A|nr:hypothetical protein [Companilactobacillus hulinensis]
MLEIMLPQLKQYDMPKFVIVERNLLGENGMSAYEKNSDIIFIDDKLSSFKKVEKILSDGYFVANDFKGVLVHELTHKRYWDIIKNMYNKSHGKYNDLAEVKMIVDEPIIKYIKDQQLNDISYLHRISENTVISWKYTGSINELVAEIEVNENIDDKKLVSLIKELLNYGYNG